MSYGTPPPGDDRPDPTSSPEQPAEGYGSPPPPPPQYGEAEPPPAAAPPPRLRSPGTARRRPRRPLPVAMRRPRRPPTPGTPRRLRRPPTASRATARLRPTPAPTSRSRRSAPSPCGRSARSAGSIDFIALAIPGYILYWLGAPKTTIVGNTIVQSGPGFLYYLGGVYILALWIYNRWYRGGTTGYTIGRGVAGCKLVKESTGETIGMGMAFVRDIAHIVDSIICYVGWLFPLWDTKRQTIADKIMSTVVLAQPQAK